ncbi:Mitochondrial carrier domain [Phytophthora cactorum]|nr:Mitochondrial carrier domain [Phytophthora cactorum]
MKNRTVPVYVKMMAGMAGGVAEACILQPLDVTKTRLQLDRTGQYKGMINCGSTIYKTEGGLALYKGLSPFYALRFGSFAWFKEQIAGGKDKPITPRSTSRPSVIIVTPFEVIKTRMQKEVGVGRFNGPIDCTRHIVRNEGVRALWKGNIPTMARQGSNQAFNFMAFAWLNHNVWDKQDGDGKTLPTYATFINGLIAGSLGPMFNSPWTSFSREEGVGALWKGVLPRLTRMAPGQAITWSVVMRVTSIFENQELELAENKIKM